MMSFDLSIGAPPTIGPVSAGAVAVFAGAIVFAGFIAELLAAVFVFAVFVAAPPQADIAATVPANVIVNSVLFISVSKLVLSKDLQRSFPTSVLETLTGKQMLYFAVRQAEANGFNMKEQNKKDRT